MFRLKNFIHLIYFFIDIAFICVSFYWPFKFNPDLVPHYLLGIRSYLSTYLFWGVVLLFLLHNAVLYYTDRYLSISGEWLKVAKCVLFSSILTALIIFALKIDIFSRIVFVEAAVSLLLSLSLWRTIKRLYVRYLIQRGYANYNVLIVGAGGVGLALAEEIKTFPYLGIRIIGFLDDTRTGEAGGIKILGRTNDIEQVSRKYFIDEIYVTIPSERKITGEIIQKGTTLCRTVRIVAEHFSLPYRQVRLNYIGAVPLMTYFEKSEHGADGLSKRLLDMAVSGLMLILLFPLSAMVAFLIKLESPGAIFYVSKRCGKKGAIFNLYKFRSMVDNADTYKESLRHKSEVKGPIFKIKNDPRITRFGKFLRKYSLDELPQLINVLKGEMSLVGPRPLPVDESRRLEDKHMPRLNIKPGITGLAQIKGRSDLPFHQWAKWDLWYSDNWSLGLDLKILWWTIPAVLNGKGAY